MAVPTSPARARNRSDRGSTTGSDAGRHAVERFDAAAPMHATACALPATGRHGHPARPEQE
jgi:hypothetical protein